MKEIRLLTANEIECRVGTLDKKNQQPKWCTLLLYKDARCDYKMLDELYGVNNWQCTYGDINGKLFCTIQIWDDKKNQWISKQNVGTESNTEAVKGEASDALKRAAFVVGIGRELYTAPTIFINLSASDLNGTYLRTSFKVAEIGYNEQREIDRLVIVDNHGVVRYQMGAAASSPQPPASPTAGGAQSAPQAAPKAAVLTVATRRSIGAAKSREELVAIYNANKGLQANSNFIGLIQARQKELRETEARASVSM